MKITINQIYIAFILCNVICKGIGLNNGSIVYQFLMTIGLIYIVFEIMIKKYTNKETIISLIILLIGILNLTITYQVTFFITCITIVGFKGIDFESLIKKICPVMTACFLVTFFAAVLGIIDREEVEIWRDTGFLTRYGMGYGHPNTLHLTMFIVLTLNYYCYAKGKISERIFLLVALLLNLLVYKYSASRTGFAVVCILELLIILHQFKLMDKMILRLPKIIFFSLLGLTLLTPVLQKMGFFSGVMLLNGRVAYTYLYLTKYGYSLFGFNNAFTETGLLLDNGYLRFLIETGLTGLLVWLYLNINVMKIISKKQNSKLAIIASCFYIYIFTESFSANIFMNYILFWGASRIFIDEYRYNKKDELKYV